MRLGVAIGLACVTHASPLQGASPILWDGRDAYTLLDRHPVDRQVLEQRDAQPERRIPAFDWFAGLADLSIGTQQAWTGGAQTRFHGYFVADTYWGARIVPGLEGNLNILVLNPSASDGYRVSSAVVPGFALHAGYPLPKIAGSTVRLDVLGTDLGWVTVGRGLLLEQTPLEGVMAGLSWRDEQVRYMFAGRGLWDGDDFEAYALSMLGGRAEITFVNWQQGPPRPFWTGPAPAAWYITAALDQRLGSNVRIAAEGAVKARAATASGETARGALLARVDYLNRETSPIAVHTGYQMRFYEQGFGPHDGLVAPTWRFNTLAQQDVYVTNPFEYYSLTHDFDVWSHTLMLEVRARVTPRLEIFADGEELLRVAVERTAGARVNAVTFGPPGQKLELFYRTGLRFYPWRGQRHRASFSVTNKQVQAGARVTDPVLVRFLPEDALWLLTLEAFL
jgi:hypothetical protein